jgi:hypothetical protein
LEGGLTFGQKPETPGPKAIAFSSTQDKAQPCGRTEGNEDFDPLELITQQVVFGAD